MKTKTRVKRDYGKIDTEILTTAIAHGKTMAEAGKLAGSKGKDIKSIAPRISQKIANDSNIKKSIIKKTEEVRNKIINSFTNDEIEKASLSQKGVVFGILTEKIQLMKGEATNILEVMPKMVINEEK